MYSVLDASMLGLNHPLSVLAPLCAKYGISGLRVPDAALESEAAAGEAAGILKDNGLQWGLLPMPADFYASNLSDEDFDKALVELSRRAKLAKFSAHGTPTTTSGRPARCRLMRRLTGTFPEFPA